MLFSEFSVMYYLSLFSSFFFFNDTATTEIYTLSLHDALPIYLRLLRAPDSRALPDRHGARARSGGVPDHGGAQRGRSEEHTSELQSQSNLVCRLLLEKKKKDQKEEDAEYLRMCES